MNPSDSVQKDIMRDDMISLLFVGDFLMSDDGRTPQLSSALYDIMNRHDIISCNFEGPISGHGYPIQKPGPNLRQNINAISTLGNWGVNLAGLANNHIMDNGIAGLNATMDILHDAGIGTCGAGRNHQDAIRPYTIHAGDMTIHILSVSEYSLYGMASASEPGCAWICHPNLVATIQDLALTSDLLIVCAHAGAECVPLPLPEWRKIFYQLCDAGADVIIGSHPHVPQPWEIYHNSFIFYSLGNGWFDYTQETSLHADGYAVSLVCDMNKALNAQIIPLKMQKDILDIPTLACFNDYMITANGILGDESLYEVMAVCQAKHLWSHSYKPLRSYIMMVSDTADSWWISYAKAACRLIPHFRLIQRQHVFDHLFAIESHRWAISHALTSKTIGRSKTDSFESLVHMMSMRHAATDIEQTYLSLDLNEQHK